MGFRDTELAILIDGTWVDAVTTGAGVQRSKGPVSVQAGRSNWAGQADPATLDFVLNNSDGRWSPRNLAGAYAGTFGRNLPVRYGIKTGTTYLGRGSSSAKQATMASAPDAAALDITGDIDVRIEIEFFEDVVEVVTDGGYRARLAAKGDGVFSEGWSWEVYRNTNQQLDVAFNWHDGSGGHTYTLATGAGLALSEEYLQFRFALRFTLDVSTGEGIFYVAGSIGGTWVQVGDAQSSAGATAMGANNDVLVVGGWVSDLSDTETFPGRIFEFELRDGIDGTLVADPTFEGQTAGASSFADSSQTWTIGTGGQISNHRWRFWGELASIPTRWSTEGADVWSPVTAAGLLRRVRRRAVTKSVPRRFLERNTSASVVQYWPCEDEGTKALDQFGAVTGTAPILVSGGDVQPGAFDGFLGSLGLPTLAADVWACTVDTHSATEWSIRWHMSVPSDWTGTNVTIVEAVTSTHRFLVQMSDTSTGTMRVQIQNSGGTPVYTQTAVAFAQKGTTGRWHLSVFDDGGDLGFRLFTAVEDSATVGGIVDTSTSVTASPGSVDSFEVNPDGNAGGYSLGHVVLYDSDLGSSDLVTEISSRVGETAAARIRRLCVEDGIRSRIYGDPTTSQVMGPQLPGTLPALLQECANTDLGILHESAESNAIAYRTRASMVAQGDTLADLSNLVAWYSTFDAFATDQTFLPNRAVILAGSTTEGATLGASTEAPTITLAVFDDHARIDPDGTNDIIDVPYTPTVTATTGALTIIFVGYWTTGATAGANERILSFEGTDGQSIYIETGAATAARPVATIGGASNSESFDIGTTDLVDGERFVAAVIIDAGDAYGWLMTDPDTGGTLTSATDITGVGTFDHTAGVLFENAAGGDNTDVGFLELMIAERVIGDTELDATGAQLYDRTQVATLRFDYAAGDIAGSLEPVEDDAELANDWTVKNARGGFARAELDDGSNLSVSEPPVGAGRYPKSVTVSTSADRLQDIADKLLAAGTVDEPRIARLPIGLHRAELADSRGVALLESRLGDLVTVDNNLAAWDSRQVAQLVQGWGQRVDTHTDDLVLFTSSAAPFRARALPASATATLGVSATPTSTFAGSGPVTVSNPDQGGGGTLLFIAVGQGDGNAPSPSITSPDAGATQVFDYDAGGGSFISRVRCWTFTEDGSTNYTFGFADATDGRSFGVIVPLDGVATTVLATATPDVVGGSTSGTYPTLSSTQADDLIVPVAVQQTTDELTGGPSDYTQRHNSTASSPQRVAVHSKLATGSSESPGANTWDGFVGAHIGFVFGFRP